MLNTQNLHTLAKNRYNEAIILLQNKRFDGAVYLCGYALELILKRRIVEILDWDEYPDKSNKFQQYRFFLTHDLELLKKLSGLEKKIQKDNNVFARWQMASAWNSGIRYREIGKISELEATNIINATKETINFILRLKTENI